jgi:hypothetical protein
MKFSGPATECRPTASFASLLKESRKAVLLAYTCTGGCWFRTVDVIHLALSSFVPDE